MNKEYNNPSAIPTWFEESAERVRSELDLAVTQLGCDLGEYTKRLFAEDIPSLVKEHHESLQDHVLDYSLPDEIEQSLASLEELSVAILQRIRKFNEGTQHVIDDIERMIEEKRPEVLEYEELQSTIADDEADSIETGDDFSDPVNEVLSSLRTNIDADRQKVIHRAMDAIDIFDETAISDIQRKAEEQKKCFGVMRQQIRDMIVKFLKGEQDVNDIA